MPKAQLDEVRIRRYFHDVVGGELQRKPQRVSFAAYALGLLSERDRKSCEPIAARAADGGGDPAERGTQAGRAHDRLLHFLAYSPWDDEAVEAGLNEFARRSYGSLAAIVQRSLDDLVGALSRNEPLEARRLASELETKGLLWFTGAL